MRNRKHYTDRVGPRCLHARDGKIPITFSVSGLKRAITVHNIFLPVIHCVRIKQQPRRRVLFRLFPVNSLS